MNRLFRITFLLALLGVVLLVPAAAQAQGGNQVRADCLEDGKLDRDYPAAALRSALGDAPSNEDEYGGDCREIIRQALANKTAGRSGSSAGAGGRPGGVGGVEGDQSADGIPDTDEDFDALQTAVRGGSDDDDDSGEGFSQPAPPFLSLGEETIVPKAPPAALAGASNDLPVPIWLALFALAALTLTAGMIAVRRRFPQVRRATLGLLRR
ncbi:MAG: hypothetical protein H0X56_05990 [Solirubrobacterales bacterium]|jgi:hypothetical protein|nr:hypothetical protein [Solirubrobacterales bacterium]